MKAFDRAQLDVGVAMMDLADKVEPGTGRWFTIRRAADGTVSVEGPGATRLTAMLRRAYEVEKRAHSYEHQVP